MKAESECDVKDAYSGQSVAWDCCGNSFKFMVLQWEQQDVIADQ